MRIRVGRQDTICRYCRRKRWFLLHWTALDGLQIRACVWDTLPAWRELGQHRA